MLIRSRDICDETQEMHEIAPYFACFLSDLLVDLDYKVHPDSDHVAKFHGDRPSELGDLAAKGIKNICGKKHKSVQNCHSGRPKLSSLRHMQN